MILIAAWQCDGAGHAVQPRVAVVAIAGEYHENKPMQEPSQEYVPDNGDGAIVVRSDGE